MWRLIEMARKWLGNIRGPKGPQGEQGEKGPQGPQGIQGPKGEKGDIPNMDLYVKSDKVYTKEEINQKLKELLSSKVTDVYTKKEVDDKLNEIGGGLVGLKLNKSKNSLLELNQYVATDNADDVVNKIIQLCIKKKDILKLSSKPIKKGATSFTLVGEPHFYVDYKGKTYEVPDSGELTITTDDPLNEKFYVDYRGFDGKLYSNDVLINVGAEYVLITLKSETSVSIPYAPGLFLLKKRGVIGNPLNANIPEQGIWCEETNYPGYVNDSHPPVVKFGDYDYQYFYAEKGATKPNPSIILDFYKDGCSIPDMHTSGNFFTKDETWEVKYDDAQSAPPPPPVSGADTN